MTRLPGLVLLLVALPLGAPTSAYAAVLPDAGDGSYAVPGYVTGDEPPRAVVERRVIGTSVGGRPIRAWRLGEPGRRRVVLISTMHGNEPHTRQILTSLRDGRPIRGIDLWVIPTYNPDGLARHSRRNAHGVDLNRNYPHDWVDLDGNYESGPRPASEPETRAVMRFLSRIDPQRADQLPPTAQRGRHRHQGRRLRPPAGSRAAAAADEAGLRRPVPRHDDRLVQHEVHGIGADRGVRRTPLAAPVDVAGAAPAPRRARCPPRSLTAGQRPWKTGFSFATNAATAAAWSSVAPVRSSSRPRWRASRRTCAATRTPPTAGSRRTRPWGRRRAGWRAR